MSDVVFIYVFLIVYVVLGPKAAKSRGEKSLRLAAAYTSYGATDKILRRLMAYEVYGGLGWLTAAARGSMQCFIG